MKKLILSGIITLIIVVTTIFSSCSGDNVGALQIKVDSLVNELAQYRAEKAAIATRLVRFDSLDFEIYSKQKWQDLHISHDDSIVVVYPDGHETSNLSDHIEALKPMFVFAPDTKITEHPIKFGSGDYTCVTGIITGTFSQAMPIGDGKAILPTGKQFRLNMCTVGQWKDGKMIRETLFWDNATLMKQIGAAN